MKILFRLTYLSATDTWQGNYYLHLEIMGWAEIFLIMQILKCWDNLRHGYQSNDLNVCTNDAFWISSWGNCFQIRTNFLCHGNQFQLIIALNVLDDRSSNYVTPLASDWSFGEKQTRYNVCRNIEYQVSESGPVLGRLIALWSRIRFWRVSKHWFSVKITANRGLNHGRGSETSSRHGEHWSIGSQSPQTRTTLDEDGGARRWCDEGGFIPCFHSDRLR